MYFSVLSLYNAPHRTWRDLHCLQDKCVKGVVVSVVIFNLVLMMAIRTGFVSVIFIMVFFAALPFPFDLLKKLIQPLPPRILHPAVLRLISI